MFKESSLSIFGVGFLLNPSQHYNDDNKDRVRARISTILSRLDAFLLQSLVQFVILTCYVLPRALRAIIRNQFVQL